MPSLYQQKSLSDAYMKNQKSKSFIIKHRFLFVKRIEKGEPMEKINAKECEIRIVDKKVYHDFVVANDRQKYAKAFCIYGLYYNDELVQLMALGKPRFDRNYQWEIICECSKINFSISGGTSKLWEYFLENNKCRSCIRYSHPYNSVFASHHINYCGFKNIKKANQYFKISYEGNYNGKHYAIDKPLLAIHGISRLLKGDFGRGKTNEEVLQELGFEEKLILELEPRVDIFYPFGLVYRVDDLTDGSFYIGMTESKSSWDSGYLGSGIRWGRHLGKHPDKSIPQNRNNPQAHQYKRTILKQDFNTPKDTRNFESEQIKKFVKEVDGHRIFDDKCFNWKTWEQLSGYIPPVCSKCGGKQGRHYKTCSEYEFLDKCSECGTAYGLHTKDCSHAKKQSICPECDGRQGNHKHFCSFAKQQPTCSECGVVGGSHKKTCSKAKTEIGCTCGTAKGGFHRKYCPLYNPLNCKYCNCKSRHPSSKHDKDCPKYKPKKVRVIKKRPPIVCSECGGKRGKHKLSCSLHIRKTCSVCGITDGHKWGCPNSSKFKYSPNSFTVCEFCGWHSGHHSESCTILKNKN